MKEYFTTSVNFPLELIRKLDVMAGKETRSRSQMILVLVNEALAEREEKKNG